MIFAGFSIPSFRPLVVCAFLTVILLESCKVQRIEPSRLSIKSARISAHRGGATAEYPENTLEALKNTSDSIEGVMLEFDVRSTRDSVLVLLHDQTLDRTTTLSGRISEILFSELVEARILNAEGDTTDLSVPTLESVFQWVKGKHAFLSIDLKVKELFKPVVDLMRANNILDQAEIITYSIVDAKRIHDYAPEIHLSMSIGSPAVLNEVRNTSINTSKVAAYTGGSIRDKTFYNALKKEGMSVTLGTMGNLDKMAAVRGYQLFKEWSELGIDRFATDIPFQVDSVLTVQMK